jgi:hypothetical protein
LDPKISRLKSESFVGCISLGVLMTDSYSKEQGRLKILKELKKVPLKCDSTSMEIFRCYSFEYPYV